MAPPSSPPVLAPTPISTTTAHHPLASDPAASNVPTSPPTAHASTSAAAKRPPASYLAPAPSLPHSVLFASTSPSTVSALTPAATTARSTSASAKLPPASNLAPTTPRLAHAFYAPTSPLLASASASIAATARPASAPDRAKPPTPPRRPEQTRFIPSPPARQPIARQPVRKTGLPASPAREATQADMVGAIYCPALASRLLDLPVLFPFPGAGLFSGKVTSSDSKEHLGGAFLHLVVFDDGDQAEYSFAEILEAHQSYMKATNPGAPPTAHPIAPAPPTALANATAAAALAPAFPTPATTTALALPPSLANYPLRILYSGTILQVSITGRFVDAASKHSYNVQLPAPYAHIPHAIDTDELHRAIAQARKQSKIAAPARKLPELTFRVY
jgi:hypothetical protein